MNEYVSEWIKKADTDLDVATFLFKNGMNLEIVAFHCQQAAEKYLKAFLVSRNIKIAKTHDLDALLLICASEDKAFNEFDRITLSAMTDFAVEYRYPVFHSNPLTEEVENYLKTTEYLGNKVKEIL
ncbi:MAG TPA: HEPN domain-containing protein [bacterium]|jgi:HEPN domain-containing protein|nr:HEPN domain-containing protein [bacterium]HOG44558.1 HEPN domain-containing protein [bacterium]HPV21414.1 HEPN domain-containing protein [bacterium]HPY15602.1 HEPN domain-containing protein [bacterium]HQB10221.1 HEPN domain-containing protein [bacterium]